MTIDPETINEGLDPVALARLFVLGRSIKKGETIAMVKALLALIDQPASKYVSSTCVEHETPAGSQTITMTPAGQAALSVVPVSKPIRPASAARTDENYAKMLAANAELIVTNGNGVFIDPLLSRWLTPDEARHIAAEITKKAGS